MNRNDFVEELGIILKVVNKNFYGKDPAKCKRMLEKCYDLGFVWDETNYSLTHPGTCTQLITAKLHEYDENDVEDIVNFAKTEITENYGLYHTSGLAESLYHQYGRKIIYFFLVLLCFGWMLFSLDILILIELTILIIWIILFLRFKYYSHKKNELQKISFKKMMSNNQLKVKKNGK